MKRWIFVLALCLALPAGAEEKKKKEKEKEAKPAVAERAAASADDFMKQAEEKERAGSLDEAIDLLRRAVAIAGASGEPSLRLGRALETKYDLDGAIDAYRSAAEKVAGPAKGEALARMAVAQALRGMAEAAASAQAATEADPDGVWPQIALSRLRAREGKADEAITLARKAVAAGGGAPASAALGLAEEAKGDLSAAEATYREVLAAAPGSIPATVGLARVLRKTGRAADAEPMLQKAIEAAPGAIDAYKESARVKVAQGRPGEAVGDAAIAAAMAENDPEAQRLVVQVKVAQALDWVGRNQADLAVQDLTALRDQNPDDADVRLGLGKALIAKRQADAAQAELAKAVEIEPGLAEAHFQLGYVFHVLKKDPAGALAPYEKAVAADPANVEYRTNLGAVLSDLKQVDRAVAELTRVTETPGYGKADAWIYIGAAYLGAKKYKEAVPPLRKAAELAPDNAQVQAYLGWTYFGLKDAENFKKHAGRAKALGHKEPTLLNYLSRIEAGEPIK